MPPASPVPGWASGDVCTLNMATRCILRCSLPKAFWLLTCLQQLAEPDVDAVDHRVQRSPLARDVPFELAEPLDRVDEVVVGQDGEVGEEVVELLELGCPLAVLCRRHLQREVARRGSRPR